ncbi:hypothetical protein [Mycoplasma bradburyae]|uniref:Lipoprotein n=1 Tax=Mycoplasma bradburyae TaxID=2963128 RepID=A0AAW6HNH8_9MOLU|nr:hypothetical protein [Mycoplasma bradburyae]MDC4182719.1 hypothetical protein [Mycoplasma bradburyae]MDC4183392.1 hypothetical protein [Mycoplasma bradburyae]UTS71165.1 hypothetical protein NMG77_01740 [Mycoplasma bradburyae]
MKRKNIFKLISLLSVGSLLSLAAASCKDDSKSATQSMNSKTTGSNSSTNRMPIDPSSEVANVQQYINGLTSDSFSIVKNKMVVKRNTVKVSELTDMSFKLATPYPETISNGWSLSVVLGQKEDTSITITVKFVKKQTTVTAANPIKLTDFLSASATAPATTTTEGNAVASGSVMSGSASASATTSTSTGVSSK